MNACRHTVGARIIKRTAPVFGLVISVITIGQENAAEVANRWSHNGHHGWSDRNSSTTAIRYHEREFAFVEFGIVNESQRTLTLECRTTDARPEIARTIATLVIAIV